MRHWKNRSGKSRQVFSGIVLFAMRISPANRNLHCCGFNFTEYNTRADVFQAGGFNVYEIIEKRHSTGVFYEIRTYDSRNSLVDTKAVQINSFNTVSDDGTTMIMLYDSKMRPIEDAIRFINFGGMDGQSRNYVLLAVSALKFLYAYLDIYGVRLKDMSGKEAAGFIDFLKGVSRKGLLYATELTVKRKNETVSSYIKVARKYVEYLGYEGHILLSRIDRFKTAAMSESDGVRTVRPYKISVKTPKRSEYIPAYINIHEYKAILRATAETAASLRDRVICRLLFEHGLRIGETLGLTLEDLKSKVTKDFQVQYSLELRNRLSDTREQNAKSAMNVTSAEAYKDPDYTRKGIGYQTVIIGENLAAELLEYINIAHNSDNRKYMERREKFSAADSVPSGNPDVIRNYYIFLNTLGRPLSANLWNKNLRAIFQSAGLAVDENVRKNNLNHRLRHGYAMYLSNVLHLSDFDVKTLMRHKSLSTTAIYHNPTPEDTEQLQERLIEKWDISLLKDGDGHGS